MAEFQMAYCSEVQTDRIEYVHQEWLKLCELLSIPAESAAKWWSYIQDSYQGVGRHYHTLNHIYSMLCSLRSVKGSLQCYEDVYLAVLFHDVVYEPKQPDNEEKSAEVFLEFVADCWKDNNVPSTITPHRISDMILMTKHHQTPEHSSAGLDVFGSDDVHYLLDCDMVILGQTKQVYEEYADAIRQEYMHIEESLYRQRRRMVLEKFLETSKIFATEHFYNLYEAAARANVKAEILSLT